LKLACTNSHDSYLINLATPDAVLWKKSLAAFVDEVERAEELGLKYVVMHPGAHVGAGEDVGIANVIRALDEVHNRCAGCKVKVLIEITAGQGSSLGHRFEHVARIIEECEEPRRLGVCFDTCHALAAGYPFSTRGECEDTLAEFDQTVGLKRIKLFHLNDSKKPPGSRVDRHEHIGEGHVGLEPFRVLLNDPRFQKVPMVLETPKHDADGKEMDPVNLATLRSLIGGE
jgi:deoxyribonuclease-4